MNRVQSYERSLERSRRSLLREDRLRTFQMNDHEWDLLDGVFAPPYSPSTGVALDFLGLSGPGVAPRHGSFLEMGCGTGVVAVLAALAGCTDVVASDINPQAVANAALNAERHQVQDRFEAVIGDMFSGLAPERRFDLIFWSSNYVLAPDGYDYQSDHERAYVDTGYAAHRRFLVEAPLRATREGSVLLHFSDRGDVEGLHRIADECGRELRVVKTLLVQEGADPVTHMLVEVGAARL